jgi:hypothetical protein
VSKQNPNYTDHDLIVDRIRHGLVFIQAAERCLRELLELVEKEEENDA